MIERPRIAATLATVALLLSVATAAMAQPTLMINEIAWAGTAAGSSDEWIELVNISSDPVDLTGWTVAFGDTIIHLTEVLDATLETRTTTLAPGAFLLLERTDDTTVSDTPADVLYKGTLSNAGLDVVLIAPNGQTVDRVSAGDGWPGGASSDGRVPYASLERVAHQDGQAEIATNDGVHRNGLDAAGEPINGTPKAMNSASILAQHAPRIAFLSVVPDVATEIVVITWSANDPDADDAMLRIALELSVDEGSTWMPIVEQLTNAGSYAWDTTKHANATGCCLRMVVRDEQGYESSVTSSVFAIENTT